NNSLIDVLGLDSLNFILGDYNVAENPNLMSFPLTIALDSIGALNVSGNGSLLDLTGLDSVRSIRGLVQIINNENLTSLDGLDSLTALRGTLRMFNNVMLSDISSLSNVDPQTITDVAIENCESLSACAIESLCTFLAGGGASSISNNAVGCNSVDEVLLACFVAVGDPADESSIVLYPNPTSGNLEISGLTTSDVDLTITDMYGHIISRNNSSTTSVDLTYLPDGMYFITIQKDDLRIVRRIMKIK
ncbi:MAG TPA: T9SS type A sorting domain-containing protein, partial [Saprospiraceae bacterium]|nr:T9SS type A sorting domain-containing protein [Saprospiraceae bacterium]